MQTMEQALAELVANGLVTADTALGATNRAEQLQGLLERAGLLAAPAAEGLGAGLRVAGS
jgi:hypothetical protein